MQLIEIAKLPTAENSAVHLHATDNIAVARVQLTPDMTLRIDGVSVVVRDPIPAGHKIALKRIEPGEIVRRYGQNIGLAKERIEPGEHIHVHNLGYRETEFAYEFPTGDLAFLATAGEDADLPWLSARRRARGNEELHCRCRGQQLCRAYIGIDCGQFPRCDSAAEYRRRRRVPARRRVRHVHRPRFDSTATDAFRRAGTSQCGRGGDHGLGLRGEPDRSLPGAECSEIHSPGGADGAE